jgi:nicotinamide mononucleotide transporter
MNWIEVLGFVFGVAGVLFTIKENAACFPAGLVNVLASFVLFRSEGLYANAVLQLFFALLLLYGWWNWVRKRPDGPAEISKSPPQQFALLLLLGLAAGMMAGWFFSKQAGAKVPYLDGITTGISVVAQWMVARKYLENWLLWIAVNLLYTGMYLYTGLYLYAILFGIYLVLAVNGWVTWKNRIAPAHG